MPAAKKSATVTTTKEAVAALDTFLGAFSPTERELLLLTAAQLLRDDCEYAVAIWTPDEMGDADQEELQSIMIERGHHFIKQNG